MADQPEPPANPEDLKSLVRSLVPTGTVPSATRVQAVLRRAKAHTVLRDFMTLFLVGFLRALGGLTSAALGGAEQRPPREPAQDSKGEHT